MFQLCGPLISTETMRRWVDSLLMCCVSEWQMIEWFEAGWHKLL